MIVGFQGALAGSRTFASRRSAVRLRALVVGAVVLLAATAPPLAIPPPLGTPAAAAASDIGTEDFGYGSSVSAPTAEKPQSKLWWNDGSWWGVLWSRQRSVYDIYRFNWSADSWTDTATAIETRNRTRADVLWDGSHLYVVSHAKEGTTGGDLGIKVLRYSYASASKTYSLDSGFPVTVASAAVEAGVIDKDSTGKLWITYTLANGPSTRAVYVVHSTTSDRTWTAPFVVPATGAANLTADDISALVSYNGKIGVMWSNQNTGTMYFASHADGAADTSWVQNPALQGPSYADDHINLKSLQADASGQVFAAVKTSLNDVLPSTSTEPLILLLVLDANGSWQRRTFGRVSDNHTRPMVLIDNQNRQLYMFAVAPCCSGGVIYMKQASLDNPIFASGIGTPFISIAADPIMTNPTSTKQAVNSTTGLLVLAADDHSQRYAHNKLSLAVSDTTPPAAPVITSPAEGAQLASHAVTLTGTAEAAASVTVREGTTVRATTSAAPDGSWSAGLTSVPDGSHTYSASATDAAGNTSSASPGRTIVVDTSPPDTTIDTGPSGTATSDTATFGFSANEAGATFACSLDAGSPSACTSPRTYTGLAEGSHTFTVGAIDQAGNPDPTPASRTWTVDLQGGTTLFSDGFESGSLSSWSTVAAGGDGSVVTQTSIVRMGTWAAQTTETANTGSFAYARKRFGIPRTDVTASGDFQVLTEGTSGGNVPLVRFYDSVGSRLVSVYRANQAKNRLEVGYGGGFFATTGVLPLNTWGQITLHVVAAGAGASTIEVKLNGSQIYRTTTATIPPPSAVQIGNETARQAGSAVADNIAVVDTAGAPKTANTTVPNFDHVFVVVEENKAASQIIGNSAAPYLNSLASANGLAANYRPIAHPSLPNYLALVGASTFGITTDCNPTGSGACPVNAPNLADRVEESGRTWRGYFDSMPLPCTTTSVNNYVVRHNPFVYFDDIRTNESRCVDGVVPFSRLATDLQSSATTPSLALIVPDKCNDMHDCSIQTGDAWLQSNLATIFTSPAWTTQNSLLVITWDEDDESASSLGTVATILVGPSVRRATVSYSSRDHYSLLKTIEQAWDLAPLTANDAAARPLAELLTAP